MEDILHYPNDYHPKDHQGSAMTLSASSSLASPGDSGVQLLDSESEVTSVMSVSAIDSDPLDIKERAPPTKDNNALAQKISHSMPTSYFDRFEAHQNSLNKSLSDEAFEMEHPIHAEPDPTKHWDLMNVSLNSYELLDYTLQNKLGAPAADQMHVSMSEEVNESMKIVEATPLSPQPVVERPVEDQIVYRRQRKKKSKSDTPKKRVSFHEDILNSTKIDDVHINHGFITHELDVGFFQRGFSKRPDVVKGRYSWAAEGDAPFYAKTDNSRETKSDCYTSTNNRFSSTSSSDSSGSIDEEEASPPAVTYRKNLDQQPKSSCLKNASARKTIATDIVEEATRRKRRSDSLLPDGNLFGSLKNILSFSTSVPLAERGVPEGQEDCAVYSTSHESTGRGANLKLKAIESLAKAPELAPTARLGICAPNLGTGKLGMRLTTGEGFYPTYSPTAIPANIIVCDSNVYEHKGISYSYEYDKFQKSFRKESAARPKSSTVYQTILKEFNFFRRRAKKREPEEDFEIVQRSEATRHPVVKTEDSIDEVEEVIVKSRKNSLSKYASSSKLDWDDSETVSDLSSENQNGRHLNSPKRRINRTNHYTISPFKVLEKSDVLMRGSASKSSLINRFLRNVTLKKMIDSNRCQRATRSRKYLSLQVSGHEHIYRGKDELDFALEREISAGREHKIAATTPDQKLIGQFKMEIFRNRLEQLLRIFPVRSAYATNGHSKALLVVLTDTTLYVTGLRPGGQAYCNHFVLPYTELNTIQIGPSAQTVHFSNSDRDMQCLISTGCGKITSELVGQVEIAMRRDLNRPKLVAVKQLGMRDMVNLRRAICKQTSIDKDEEYFYYSIVNIQDFNPEINEVTPLGPNKEGPLMFRTIDAEARWETAYFILKAGMLYMLSSASQRVPMRVFPLINGSCHGARRVFDCPRPHTFQLIIEGKQLHLAAPDEYVASDWLQCLVHAASGGYHLREKILTHSCSLLMTTNHILTVREAFACTIPSLLPPNDQHQPIKGPQVLSCAAIIDLVSFRLPSAEQSWCILEFSCREVHECSGDWILYFGTNTELENFIHTLELLWSYNNDNGDSFPLSTIEESDPLSKKCVDIYTSLQSNWPSNLVHLQFL